MITLYCARWILPISSTPVEDGAVAVEGERIVGVGARETVAGKFPEARLRDFGEAVVLPGLVNSHSHLELTAMRGFLEREEGDFLAWLRKLTIARLEKMTPDDILVSATYGAVEAVRAGVTCLGDASDAAHASMRALRDVGLRGTVFQESFGPDPRQARENFEKLREKVARLRATESELVRAGISPHAPYTISAPQLELLTDFALAEKLPVMMHAAESAAEAILMREGGGPFAEGLARRGIAWRAPGTSTVQYLNRLGVLRARPLLAHCIRVDEADIEALKVTGTPVAHCPKSNAKLGHGHAPYSAFIRNNLTVGLGTDSVASNNTCDMLEEARFAALLSRATGAHNSAGRMTTAEDLLFTATLGGARALGLDGRIGALAEGLQADLAIVALGGAHQQPVYDPATALVFSSSAREVVLTVVAGREVYRDGRVVTVDEDRLRARVKEMANNLRPEI